MPAAQMSPPAFQVHRSFDHQLGERRRVDALDEDAVACIGEPVDRVQRQRRAAVRRHVHGDRGWHGERRVEGHRHISQQRRAHTPGRRGRVGNQHEGLRVARATGFAIGEDPPRGGRRRAGGVVGFGPEGLGHRGTGEPHRRRVDDDRHGVGRRDRARQGGVDERLAEARERLAIDV